MNHRFVLCLLLLLALVSMTLAMPPCQKDEDCPNCGPGNKKGCITTGRNKGLCKCTRLNPPKPCTPNLTDCPAGQYCNPNLRQCTPRPNCQMQYETCSETKKCCEGTECILRLHTSTPACFSSASTGEDCTKLKCEGFRTCVNGKCSADRGESCDQFPCPTDYTCKQGLYGGTCEK